MLSQARSPRPTPTPRAESVPIEVVDVVEIVDARGRRRIEVFGPAGRAARGGAPRRPADPLPARCGWLADSSLDLLAGLDVTFGDAPVPASSDAAARAAPMPVAPRLPFVARGGASSQTARRL